MIDSNKIPALNPTPQTQVSGGANPEAETITQPEDMVIKSDFDNYSSAQVRINKLISDFKPQEDKIKQNRDRRFKELDIEKLKKQKIIAENEFMIPMRVIDSNIRREQPAFFNYLKQSRRLLIFKNVANPLSITNTLEDEFSRGMTYSNWDIPHFKVVDGSQTHGWDNVEVVFDKTKPLHVAIEHIGTDNLIFPVDAIDLQACEVVARKYTVTAKQLRTMVNQFGFSKDQVTTILSKEAQEANKDRSFCIYKVFFKREDVVNVGWYYKDCSDWLKSPDKLSLGILVQQPTMAEDGITEELNWVEPDITFYPVFQLPYYETEQIRIVDHKGRVFLDNHKQEALTANISQFLNGCQKASTIEASVKTEVARNAEIQSIELGRNKVSPIPLDYFSPPYPDSVMLQLQNYLDAANSQEAGQVNFAVNNRKDSRKTATEISAASDENAMLKSVQVSLYSAFIRQVYTVAWKIVQSQALQGLITFLVDVESGQNNVAMIAADYDIRAAGDVDVIKRQELIMQYKEFWPIIQTTPAAIPFLSRLLRLVFLDEGNMYANIIEGGDPRALIAQLAQVLSDPAVTQALLPVMADLPPEQKQILITLLEQVKQTGETYMQEQILQNPSIENKMAAQDGLKEESTEQPTEQT